MAYYNAIHPSALYASNL